MPITSRPIEKPAPVTWHQVDVLVVDDDADIRTMLQSALEAEGYLVATAGDGPEALRSIPRAHPTLVLLDVSMPGMDGWQVFAQLQAWDYRVPVVFISAEPLMTKRAHGLGAAGALPKPFDLGQLLDVVERLTEHPHN